ncbi:hypothetical protein BM536_034760 [Streptomyces phaeoluteigriseus]|uniref:Uncharacterized protein n=1 Tax=Streptomyces phaeoluteigriseus TaxID=114686 RepID=A0A1V6MIG9_9ACTN|nr:hypothetical protein BM536_034760 [Streptomyces phaeoluteigriseus]
MPVSGVWCVRPQGGGGRRRGASATDDNAADAHAGPRVCDVIRTTGLQPRRVAPRPSRPCTSAGRRCRRCGCPSGRPGRRRWCSP